MIQFQLHKEVFNFRYLPAFAQYLLDKKLEEYVLVNIRFCREHNLPLLKPLSKYSETELLQLSLASNRAMLEALAQNRISDHINQSAQRWINNELGVIDREELVAEDLTVGFYIRRKGFTYFLDAYTKNVVLQKLIIAEVDIYTTQEELLSYSIYLGMQQERLNNHKDLLLQTQELADTGAFLVNFEDRAKSLYTPQYLEMLGFDKAPGYEEMIANIHPDDIAGFRTVVEHALKNGGTMELEYRYLRRGEVRRFSSKVEVEVRNGKPALLKGCIRDITGKQDIIDQLKETEQLYLMSQELNAMGTWSWDLSSGRLKWSDEMYHIFEVEKGTAVSPGDFVSFVHPDDRAVFQAEIETISALPDGRRNEYLFSITTAKGNRKLLKGISKVEGVKNVVVRCFGTCQDITHQHDDVK